MCRSVAVSRAFETKTLKSWWNLSRTQSGEARSRIVNSKIDLINKMIMLWIWQDIQLNGKRQITKNLQLIWFDFFFFRFFNLEFSVNLEVISSIDWLNWLTSRERLRLNLISVGKFMNSNFKSFGSFYIDNKLLAQQHCWRIVKHTIFFGISNKIIFHCWSIRLSSRLDYK